MTNRTHRDSATNSIESQTEHAFTAQNWFSKGERVPYDYQRKQVVDKNDTDSDSTVYVFRRHTPESSGRPHASVTTFLPGFPDGSFGFSRIDSLLPDERRLPRLFVEFVGQGDSDKPSNYRYSTIERTDLVEAQWRDLKIRSTFIVTFDYSSLVVLELLSRQQDRINRGEKPETVIEGVLFINGGLFADSHTHPWFTTPLLKTPIGRIGVWFAQRSRFIFGQMVSSLWSKEYNVTKEEIDEMFDAITRRNGAQFLSNGARFVDEHKRNAKRWNLKRLYHYMKREVSFHVVGSEKDPFEWKQVVRARKRLGKAGLDIRLLPGGHLTTSEQPEKLAAIILELIGGRQTEPAALRA